MNWDIFCKVIDNHGDIGVCWRLSAQLASRGEDVRLWVDDASALAWMAPGGNPRVQVLPWQAQEDARPGDVVIEAFGCALSLAYQAAIAASTRASGRQPAWINLEYLTAERFAERNHGLPSPLLAGPAAGLTKHFFYPGFTPRTGGLLREADLLRRQAAFDAGAWLQGQDIEIGDGERLVSLFCYEPAALDQLLDLFAAGPGRTRLLVTSGRAAAAVRAALARLNQPTRSWSAGGRLAISWLPLLSQADFDHLLWACDLNFVRGEDSLVRALWAGKPLVWQIYPQEDQAHHAKLDAFLDWLKAPPAMRQFHHGWNGLEARAPILPLRASAAWQGVVESGRHRLLAQDDLAGQLLQFVGVPKKR